MFSEIAKKLSWPLRKLSTEVSEEVAEKAAIGARAALAEAPMLDDLLDGKPIELVMTIQLRRKA